MWSSHNIQYIPLIFVSTSTSQFHVFLLKISCREPNTKTIRNHEIPSYHTESVPFDSIIKKINRGILLHCRPMLSGQRPVAVNNISCLSHSLQLWQHSIDCSPCEGIYYDNNWRVLLLRRRAMTMTTRKPKIRKKKHFVREYIQKPREIINKFIRWPTFITLNACQWTFIDIYWYL